MIDILQYMVIGSFVTFNTTLLTLIILQNF